MPLRTFVKCVVLGLLDNAKVVAREHTVERARKVWLTATFPLVTDRANDPKLWRSCMRTAWRGLVHRHPDALDYFVTMRRNVESARRPARRDTPAHVREQLREMMATHLFPSRSPDVY
jgi:hypothetical protein